LVITKPTVLENKVYNCGPEMVGKTMIEIPSSPTNRRLEDVHLNRVTLNCNGIAGAGLAAIDLWGSSFTNVQVIAPTVTAYYLAGETFAMQYCDFLRCSAWCIWNTGALLLDGTGPGVGNNANVCFGTFKSCYFHTEGGTSLEIRDCDTCTFENCGFETVTGFAVRCYERGSNAWENNDPGPGRMYFAHPERENFVSWGKCNGAPNFVSQD
jgi:hypothetical protein